MLYRCVNKIYQPKVELGNKFFGLNPRYSKKLSLITNTLPPLTLFFERNNMKFFTALPLFAFFVAAILSTDIAHAQEPPPPTPPPIGAEDWTTFYITGEGNYKWEAELDAWNNVLPQERDPWLYDINLTDPTWGVIKEREIHKTFRMIPGGWACDISIEVTIKKYPFEPTSKPFD